MAQVSSTTSWSLAIDENQTSSHMYGTTYASLHIHNSLSLCVPKCVIILECFRVTYKLLIGFVDQRVVHLNDLTKVDDLPSPTVTHIRV
jgi:hypothetical protein